MNFEMRVEDPETGAVEFKPLSALSKAELVEAIRRQRAYDQGRADTEERLVAILTEFVKVIRS